MSDKKQVALIVLDGWGYREDLKDNAIQAADTPSFDKLWQEYPHSLLDASGLSVGVPEGQIGNSEVGHTTIGCGSIIDSDLVRINKSIKDGTFSENRALKKLFSHVEKNKSTLHCLGIIGKGGVHGHSEHLFAFLTAAKEKGITDIAVHAFTDGRDAAPYDAVDNISELQKVIDDVGVGYIASISGRYFAMDRDKNWDRLEKVENVIFECSGNVCQISPEEELKRQYKEGKTDEHIEPFFIKESPIKKGDGVFFFNFRADRARMLSEKVTKRADSDNIHFVTMTKYDDDLNCDVAFPPLCIETTLANEISKSGRRQIHVAETEKFPHATYFLNGGREEPHEGEEHIMLQSRKDVKTHDEAPEMRAKGIADEAIKGIEGGVDFTFINFANPDMVGHTANVPAIITAVETVDRELKRVVDALEKVGGVAVIIADHGNAELNVDQDSKEKHTAHTLSKVPCIITDKSIEIRDGGLSDVAPTVIELFKLEKPEFMTGKSLIS
jgi:2,3-bisphosphoglycerate-independent phosphoglycerate mutase